MLETGALMNKRRDLYTTRHKTINTLFVYKFNSE